MIALDLDTLTAAIAGDHRAVTAVLARMRGPVLSYCARHLLRRGDAEDLTQEVLIEVVQTLPRVVGPHVGQFVSLVFAIARHRLVYAVRRRYRDKSSPWDEVPDVPCALSPDRVVEGRETIDELAVVLGQLTPFQRSVVAMRAEGLSSAAIGSVLGRPDTSVRVEHHRAMVVLRAWAAGTPNQGGDR